jgi:hypothetical protein
VASVIHQSLRNGGLAGELADDVGGGNRSAWAVAHVVRSVALAGQRQQKPGRSGQSLARHVTGRHSLEKREIECVSVVGRGQQFLLAMS